MKVHRSTGRLPKFKNAVITIGTFDGVHEGHKKVIQALADEAKRVDGETVIITFDPHPRKVINRHTNLQLINTLEERILLLGQTEINHLVIVPFTKEFAELTAEEYIDLFLIRHFDPATIIIGYDHHFGKGRRGDYTLLQESSLKYNFRLLDIPKHVLDEIDVSSTRIRRSILGGEVDMANRLLGYSFFFEGKVVKGDQLGRELGYPTANLVYTDPDKIHLGHGVYAVLVEVDGEMKKGMLSIGNRPTLPDSDEKVEVNIFDLDKDLYDQVLKVTIKTYIRPQEKYRSLEELIDQLAKDKERSLSVLK